MTARGLLARPSRVVAGGFVRARTRGWPRHSRLFAVGERTGWSVDEDARHVEAAARRLGYEVAPSSWASFAAAQSVFLTSHFEALQPRWLDSTHRLGTAYLHGRPGTEGYPEFDRAFEALRSAPERFSRIQVTHGEMRDLVLEAGVDRRSGAPHPDRDRPRELPARNARAALRGASSVRRPQGRVRGRLVPEGRRRVGRRPRAEADQGPRRAGGRARSRARGRTGAPRAADRAGPGLRPPRARTGRHPVWARTRWHPSGARGRLSGSRRLSRPRPAGGRTEVRARVDGVRRSARHDPGRPGDRARGGRIERLARGRRGRRTAWPTARSRSMQAVRLASSTMPARRPSATRSSAWTRCGKRSSTDSWNVSPDEPHPAARPCRARCRAARAPSPLPCPHAALALAAALAALALGPSR